MCIMIEYDMVRILWCTDMIYERTKYFLVYALSYYYYHTRIILILSHTHFLIILTTRTLQKEYNITLRGNNIHFDSIQEMELKSYFNI